MIITVSCRFRTLVMGSAPAKGYTEVLTSYIEDKVDKNLLTFAEQNAKKNQDIGKMITDILSVFHRDDEGDLAYGSWQAKRCLTETAMIYMNGRTNKRHPKKDIIPYLVQTVEPYFIKLYDANGDPIRKAEAVWTEAVTIKGIGGKKGRSFFTAYEYLPAGTAMQFSFTMDEEYLKEEHEEEPSKDELRWWVTKAGILGSYAYRERFGKWDVTDLTFD